MTTSNHRETEALIRRYYDAMLHGNLEDVWACYDPDIVYEDAALGHRFEGLEQTKAFYTTYMMALNVKVYIESLITTDSAYAIEFRMEGQHTRDLPGMPATGKSFSLKGATYGQVANGRITRNTDYWNLSALLAQLGMA